jgi:hypothetical protein
MMGNYHDGYDAKALADMEGLGVQFGFIILLRRNPSEWRHHRRVQA